VTRRLFVAAWLPDAAAREAAGVLRRLRADAGVADVKWVSPENLHVTLRFLGDVEEDRVPAVRDCVERAAAGVLPFRLRLAGVGAFPPRGAPRVLWIGIADGAKELARLASRTEKQLLDRGLIGAPETRPFRAHVTLGRPRGTRSPGRTADLLGEVAFEGGAHRLEEVRLVESRLSPRGASYTAVARVPLGGARASESTTLEGGTT
jgi:2'-5' RNA ligase